MKSILIILFCCYFAIISGFPTQQKDGPIIIQPLLNEEDVIKISPENIANLPPVDSSLFENDVDESFEQEKLVELIRSGIIGDQYKWRSQINFQISTAFSTTDYNTIHASLQNLAGVLSNCLTVGLWPQDASPTGDYVFITNAQSGCFSSVGRRGGRQTLNLQTPGCVSQGTVVHEAIHAVGFHHEQIRPDRDTYVTINWGNIQSGTEHNFQTSSAYPQTYGVPYDYYSIMHYGETAFSSNGGKTIQAKNGVVVGSRGVVTDYDRRKVRAMYGCSA